MIPDPLVPLPAGIPHGTANGYRNYRCRCDDCRVANSAYQRAFRAQNPPKYAAYMRRYRAISRQQGPAQNSAPPDNYEDTPDEGDVPSPQ
jgi:hypothetical protein